MEYADRDAQLEARQAWVSPGEKGLAGQDFPERVGISPLETAISEIENELELLYNALRPVLNEDVFLKPIDETQPGGPSSPLAYQVDRLRKVRQRLTEHLQRLDI